MKFITSISQRPANVLMLIVAAAAALRYSFIEMNPYVWGIDTWSYVLNVGYLLGEPIAEPELTIVRAPLGPGYLLMPFYLVWGAADGVAYWSLVASLPVIPASYFFGRSFLTRGQALFAATAVAFSYNITEAYVNGAVILQSLAALLVALRILLDYSRGSAVSWRQCAALAVVTALMPFLNQTFSAIYIILFALCLPLAIWERMRALGDTLRDTLRSVDARWLFGGLTIGGAVALTALPWYASVSPDTYLLRSYMSDAPHIYPIIFDFGDTALPVYRPILVLHFFLFFCAAVFTYIARAPRIVPVILAIACIASILHAPNEAVGNPIWRMRYVGDVLLLMSAPFLFNRMLEYWPTSWRHPAVSRCAGMYLIVMLAGCSVWIGTNLVNSDQADHRAIISAANYANAELGLGRPGVLNPYTEQFAEAFHVDSPDFTQIVPSSAIVARLIIDGYIRYPDFLRLPDAREYAGLCVIAFPGIVHPPWTKNEFRLQSEYECDPVTAAASIGIDSIVAPTSDGGWVDNVGWDNYIRGMDKDAPWLTRVYERDGAVVWAIQASVGENRKAASPQY